MLQDVKQKITEIRHRQRMAIFVIFVGIALFVLGGFLASYILMLGFSTVVGLLIFLVGIGVWLYYSAQKTKMIEKLRNYLALKELKTRLGEHEDWELIQELLSS